MATLNSYNAAKLSNKSKIAPGEFNGRLKGIFDKLVMTAVLANNDEVDSLTIPEGALIVEAWVKSPSLGVTGIVNLGLRAFEDIDGNTIPEDSDGLVQAADAGGQAVMKRADLNSALIGKKVGKGGAQVFLHCSEVSVESDETIEWFVGYLLP